jgi:hypothetical protein
MTITQMAVERIAGGRKMHSRTAAVHGLAVDWLAPLA